jgi:hypothetical protein
LFKNLIFYLAVKKRNTNITKLRRMPTLEVSIGEWVMGDGQWVNGQ